MIFVLLSFSGAVAADNPESGADKAPVEYRVNIEYLYTSENDWNIDTINPDIRRSITAIEKINLYNFMWRGGPVVKYDLGNTRTLARKIREAWFGCRQGSRGEAVSRWKRDPDNAVGGQNRRARRVRSFAKMIQSSTFCRVFLQAPGYLWPIKLISLQLTGTGERFNEFFGLGVGCQWMHVSNGQGMGDRNPSYDAEGPRLTYSFVF